MLSLLGRVLGAPVTVSGKTKQGECYRQRTIASLRKRNEDDGKDGVVKMRGDGGAGSGGEYIHILRGAHTVELQKGDV